jgi:hypothetical protein
METDPVGETDPDGLALNPGLAPRATIGRPYEACIEERGSADQVRHASC